MMAGKVRVSGPLAPYAAGFAEWLAGQGYAPSTVGHQLTLVARLSRWLEQEEVPPPALSEAVAQRFAQSVQVTGRARPTARAVDPVLGYLRGLGAVPLPEPPRQESPHQRLLAAYERYLSGDRSLSPATVTKYMHIATAFLAGLPDPFDDAVAGLSADQVIGFACGKGSGAKSIAGGLRVLLRYLYLSGYVDRQLAGAVPPIAAWKLAGLPARLDAAEVAAVLGTCDRATVTGRRDYAVLILLARLGLRAHEAAGLELDDIRWRSGTVVLRRKGGRSEELPLPADAGQAVADYLLTRPAVSGCRAVFISAVAPRRPLTRSAVTLLARRHCAAAGIASGGAHRLRHTLASDLLAAGASLAEIGLVLGHRSPFVTSIYAKVDRAALGQLARPWPLAGTLESRWA